MNEKKESSLSEPLAKNEGKEGEEKQELNSKELKNRLEDCERQKNEYLAGWQEEKADFLNYKKDEMERLRKLIGYAKEEIILKILPILDNFEISEKKLPDNLKNDESIKGVLQIKNQVLGFLKAQGVEEIKSVGERFDPNIHEVVGEAEPSVAKAMEGKEIKSGIIIEEIQKGYKINGRLLRPAKVKVAK